MKDPSQNSLFGDLEELDYWRKEWQGMPEFVRGDTTPFQKIIVNFKTKEDVREFAKLLGQNITFKTDSIWFPKITYPPKNMYVDMVVH